MDDDREREGADDLDPTFLGDGGADIDEELRKKQQRLELFDPSEHTERVDPGICRLLVLLSAFASLLALLAGPLLSVAALGLAWVARSLGERRFSGAALALSVASALLYYVLRMCAGCAAGAHGMARMYGG